MAYTAGSVAGGEGNTTFNATNVEFLGKNLEFPHYFYKDINT